MKARGPLDPTLSQIRAVRRACKLISTFKKEARLAPITEGTRVDRISKKITELREIFLSKCSGSLASPERLLTHDKNSEDVELLSRLLKLSEEKVCQFLDFVNPCQLN